MIIQNFTKEHSEQTNNFLLVLCDQAKTLRVAEPTLEWTHANAMKMGAAVASINLKNKPPNGGGGYKGQPLANYRAFKWTFQEGNSIKATLSVF